MQKLIFFVTLVFTMSFFSCEDNTELMTTLPDSLIDRVWIHAHEDDKNTLAVYRPADVITLPISRYRQTFLFNADQTCDYSVLAPNDAHYGEKGYWNFDMGVVSIFNDDDQLQFRLEIVEANSQVLKIRK